MTRRRFAYTMGGVPLHAPVEVSEDFLGGDGRMPLFTDRFMEGDVSPDGTDIGSRTKRRAWMAATGSADYSDFNNHFKRAAMERRADTAAPGLREAIRDAVRQRRK